MYESENYPTRIEDAEAFAEVLRRILQRYEPGARHEPVVDGDYYGPRLRRLCAIHLDVVAHRAKFKLGPYGPVPLKREVARRLRARGSLQDVRAADVIESWWPGRLP